MDHGRQTFLVRLVPHAGDWREADVVRRAAELNQPPFALIETFHEGPLPAARGHAIGRRRRRVLTVVKGGEDGGYAFVRSRRRAAASTATLTVLGRTFEANFGAARDQDVRAAPWRRRSARDRPARVVSSLDGDDWQLQGWLGEEWRWHVNKPWDAPGLAAGARARQRPRRPRARRRGRRICASSATRRLAEWVAAAAWIYRRAVAGPGAIRFEGVDHEATVFVDGEEVARHEGAFTPFEVERRRGRAPARGRRPRRAGERAAGRRDEPRARAQEPDGLRLGLLPAARAPGDLAAGDARSRRPSVFPVVTLGGRRRHGRGRRRGRAARRAHPELWWPNGIGEQQLYDVESEGSVRGRLPRRSRFDDYALRRQRRRGRRSGAGTGCRSTRSTACRGRRSSRTCSGWPRART